MVRSDGVYRLEVEDECTWAGQIRVEVSIEDPDTGVTGVGTLSVRPEDVKRWARRLRHSGDLGRVERALQEVLF